MKITTLLVLLSHTLIAQQKFTRTLQFSFTPGISSNGMDHSGFVNYFSLNATSGLSYSNLAFELGIVSNQNLKDTRGLQIAGLVNTTGTNAFSRLLPREVERLKREGFEANLSGAQFSGVANIVLNNVFGWQTSGGINLAKGALIGLQIAGVSNTVYRYSFGVQLAGLYNVSVQSMDGVQVAGLFNVTTGGLYGVQVSAFNRAGMIQGKNSFANNEPTGVQLGLVNIAGLMNGFQIGLINFGRRTQGTQIGLINIYGKGKDPLTRDGTSIGLINLGESIKVRGYTSDLFLANTELSTGTLKNGRMTTESVTKYFQNALIYSWNPGKEAWAIGYGVQMYYFNKTTQPGMNRFRYICFEVDWMHINHQRKEITKTLNLVTRPQVSVGSRLHPKNQIGFLFVAVAYNYYLTDSNQEFDGVFGAARSSRKNQWPGFAAGVMIH